MLNFLSSGKFTVNNITPNEDGESSKVKVKVNINRHGIFSVSSAAMVIKLPPEPEPEEPKKEEGKKVNGKEDGVKEGGQGDDKTNMETEPTDNDEAGNQEHSKQQQQQEEELDGEVKMDTSEDKVEVWYAKIHLTSPKIDALLE